MHKKRVIIIFAFFTLFLLGISLFLKYQNDKIVRSISSFEDCLKKYRNLKIYQGKCVTPDGRSFMQDMGNGSSLKDHIQVTIPKPQAKIKSPVSISGKARGTWFFEATFPIELIDANGNTLGKGIMRTDEEWMTENFVKFSGELAFEKPKTKMGKLLLRNDNPSGLPENSKMLVIPINFK